jgi:hypothetical protein
MRISERAPLAALSCQSAPCRFFQTPLEIFSNQLCDLWMIVEDLADPLENRVEIDALSENPRSAKLICGSASLVMVDLLNLWVL